jgi:hypothetical protein
MPEFEVELPHEVQFIATTTVVATTAEAAREAITRRLCDGSLVDWYPRTGGFDWERAAEHSSVDAVIELEP